MIVLDVEQGSAAWLHARMGLATASQFHRIVTPARLQRAKGKTGADSYLAQLLAEWATGTQEEWTSAWAERGTALEPEARRAYEFEEGIPVQAVGFVYKDDEKLVGCSPDGLVGEFGGLELKCPAAKTHIANLMDPDAFVAAHRMQVQGGLWVTGRDWWHLMSYYPGLPPVIEVCYPDEAVQAALDTHLPAFLDELKAGRQKLLDLGVTPKLTAETPEWARPSVDGLEPGAVHALRGDDLGEYRELRRSGEPIPDELEAKVQALKLGDGPQGELL